jgi:signal transduction histidine kinase
MVSRPPAPTRIARHHTVLWPMLLTVVLLSASFFALLYLQHTGRAFTGTQARWSMARNAASHALLQYVVTRSPQAHERFARELTVVRSTRQALRQLNRADGDLPLARRELVAAGALADDADHMVRVYRWVSAHPRFLPLRERWQLADMAAQDLIALSDEVHGEVQRNADVPEALVSMWLTQLDAIDRRMSALERATQADLAASGRVTYQMMVGSQLCMGLVLGALCVWTTRRFLRELADHARGLKRANDRTALALQCAGMGLFELDGVSGTYRMDERVAGLHGMPGTPAIGRAHMRSLVHPDDVGATRAAIDDILQRADTGTCRLNYRVRWPDGQWRHIESHGRLDADSGLVLGVSRDVTDDVIRRQAAAQWETERQVSQAQRTFLSRLSHELRTPLNAILGFAHILGREENRHLREKDRRHIDVIAGAGRQLLGLVDDVLDLSKVEAGEIGMTLVATDIAEVLGRCLPIVDNVAHSHQVRVQADLPPPGLMALADPQRLQQVFTNLMSNGCKYNRQGGALRVDVTAHEGQVTVGFEDEGDGLSEADLGRLFKPFQRIDRTAGQVEGSGLGLYIVKQMVEGMGGEVRVRSQPGIGSRFEVVLLAHVALTPSLEATAGNTSSRCDSLPEAVPAG